ncbi:extracellular serine/threonine protein kinase FAM20C [Parasteatoda tepidariorum]|uniref:extracellular serine/threonine protein kinase FAM20C n=1 Tax=Parasteatoda tepidariorum TaxID=114398 RepID=UPI0039BD2979
MLWNLDHNPNLAEIWETRITKEMPNWKKFLYNISKYYLYEDSPLIDDLLHDMANKKIIAVDVHPGGTQFKLIVLFEDGGRALFKPMRFPRHVERNENVLYLADYERHVSEIAAFHLDRLLGFRRVPPVVGRKINITGELLPLVLDDIYMVDTFFYSPDGNYCLAGICKMYCSELFSGFCGNPYMLEGSFAVYIPPLPVELLEHREVENPWRRTYQLNVKAEWEKDPSFCKNVIQHLRPFNETRRLYDAVDCAIFDFLIGNENRVNFDEFTVFGADNTNTLIHFDNGQGFGRSDHDELSILSPLSQCCLVRLSTFNRLYELYVGERPLSELMRESLAKDPLSPILTESHLEALDRRLEKVLALIRLCLIGNGGPTVFQDDVI